MIIEKTTLVEARVPRVGFWSWLFPTKLIAQYGVYRYCDEQDPEAWAIVTSEWSAKGHERVLSQIIHLVNCGQC